MYQERKCDSEEVRSEVAVKYVRKVQDMYEDSETVIRCSVGVTDGLKLGVGVHQESALGSVLFAMVMDRLTDKIRQESTWVMRFADDIVICRVGSRWRRAWSGGGMLWRGEE